MIAPTIKDVARQAQVSVATVSYVINDGPRPVTSETRDRVLAAMQELGYEPNVSARRLRRQHNQVLGLAIAGLSGLPGLSDLYFLDIMRGVGVAADRHEYDLMLFSSPRKLQSADYYQSLARKRMVDGLIVSGSLFNYESVSEAERDRLPVVVVGRQTTSSHLRHVVFSYEADVFNVTQVLAQMGHRRIALLLNDLRLRSEPERLRGYQHALEVESLAYDPALVYLPDKVVQFPPRDVVVQIVEQAGATAIVTAPYYEVCAYVAEMNVDVAVATLDEEMHIPRPAPLLIGVRLGKYEAGQRAVEMLLDVIEGKPDVPEEVVVASSSQVYPAGGRPSA